MEFDSVEAGVRRFLMVFLAIIASCPLGSAADHRALSAFAEPPSRRVSAPNWGSTRYPYILGIGTHLGSFIERPIYEPSQTSTLVSKLGFDSVRDDVGEANLEKDEANPANHRNAALTNFLGLLRPPVRPLLDLTIGDSSRFGGGLPMEPADRQAFVAFARKAARKFSSFHPAYEIWNEWNLGTATRSHLAGSATDYVKLAAAAYPAIKAADPTALVLTGATASDIDPMPFMNREWFWMTTALQAGLIHTGDGVSVHMYNSCRSPSSRTTDELMTRLSKLDSLLRRYNGGKTFPIYITEAGWPAQDHGCGFTEFQRGAYLAQFLLWLPAVPAVKGVWLYELKDSGTDPNNTEHHFGLLDYNYQRKPYTCAYDEARSILSGMKFKALRRVSPTLISAEFSSGSDVASIQWTTIPSSPASSSVPANKIARQFCSNRTWRAGERYQTGIMPVLLTDARKQ